MAARSTRTLVIGLSIAAVVAVAMVVTGFRLRPISWSCRIDDEIAADERDSMAFAALEYTQRVLGPDPTSAYELLSAGARADITAEQLRTNYQQRQQQIGPLTDWSVKHIYVVKLTGTNEIQPVICGQLSRPDDQVVVAAQGGPAEAHVLLEGQSPHHKAAFALWMVREDRAWRVRESHLRPVSYMGKTASDFEELAKAEQRDHRLLNAALLYVEAEALADRGPRMQLGVFTRIVKEFRSVKVPGPLAGDPPFTWKADGTQFKVLNVAPIGLGDGKGRDVLWVVVTHELDPWVDNESAERTNRELIAAFRKTYPSYRRSFAGLVVRAQEKDRGKGVAGWGTVHQEDESAAGESSRDPEDLSPDGGQGSRLTP